MVHLAIEYTFNPDSSPNRLAHPLMELLACVHDTGSIGKAALKLGRSYRYVWGELKRWETELNTDLIVWGRSKKGADLTPKAREFLLATSQAEQDLAQELQVIKRRVEACFAILK